MERNAKRNRLVGPATLAAALALGLAGLVALSAQARERESSAREPSPDRAAARMAERLGLSAEQKAQVQEILTQGRAKRTEISNKRNEAIKAILTAEQKPVFEKNLADMQAMMQQRQRPPR